MQHTKYLILAWGNPGRGDDAAGLEVADSLAAHVGGDVAIRSFHQLGPELAEDVAHCDHVIFIDAHVREDWPDLSVRQVLPASDYRPGSHSSSPEELLALARVLYHRQPEAQLVAMRAFDTTFGADLSPRMRELVCQARQAVLDLLAAEPSDPAVQP